MERWNPPLPPNRRLSRPIIGYSGNLTHRFDWSLVDSVANQRRDWTIVLIGATTENPYFEVNKPLMVEPALPRFANITDRILAALDQGTIPWRKPWKCGGAPRNLLTGKPYRGLNILLTAMQGYASPYWITFRQAAEKGGQVRSGEKGTPIIFWNWQVRQVRNDDGDFGDGGALPAGAMLKAGGRQSIERISTCGRRRTSVNRVERCRSQSASVAFWPPNPSSR